jgi:hypothetical protein
VCMFVGYLLCMTYCSFLGWFSMFLLIACVESMFLYPKNGTKICNQSKRVNLEVPGNGYVQISIRKIVLVFVVLGMFQVSFRAFLVGVLR